MHDRRQGDPTLPQGGGPASVPRDLRQGTPSGNSDLLPGYPTSTPRTLSHHLPRFSGGRRGVQTIRGRRHEDTRHDRGEVLRSASRGKNGGGNLCVRVCLSLSSLSGRASTLSSVSLQTTSFFSETSPWGTTSVGYHPHIHPPCVPRCLQS